jgi:hypothetical protein
MALGDREVVDPAAMPVETRHHACDDFTADRADDEELWLLG